MNPVSNNSDLKNGSIITIGTFDGVHIGHQKIIERLVNTGNKNQLTSVVLTFFPHPRMVLQPDYELKLLHTIDERHNTLSKFGLDNIVVKEFTKEFANLSAGDYVQQILVEELNAKHIIIGYDHHFGKNRTANIDDLRAYGAIFDFNVEEISAQDVKDVAVSSTKIRQALNQGNIETANAFLGYPYFLTGKVIKGKGVGKTLAFPTANIYIKQTYKLIPKNGVYVIKSVIDDTTVFGMMNIGTNPTFNEKQQSIEVHFFNLNEDLYNKSLKIEVLHRLRDEQKFSSIADLKIQLHRDELESQAFVKIYNE